MTDIFSSPSDPALVSLLQEGGVVVLATDTIYGVVCQAKSEAAVERIYKLKGRSETKSPIVLIATLDQLFDQPSQADSMFLESVWPGPVSVIMPSTRAPNWIRRQNASVAYRLPASEELRQLVRKTGPLIAPSANPQGEPPATTCGQAQAYFGDSVDAYVDGGDRSGVSPSSIWKLDPSGEPEQLR